MQPVYQACIIECAHPHDELVSKIYVKKKQKRHGSVGGTMSVGPRSKVLVQPGTDYYAHPHSPNTTTTN